MNNFIYGLICGLVVALAVFITYTAKLASTKRTLKEETEKYKKMLTDRMELESQGIDKLKSEVEELKKINENLRISLTTMSQKPGRKEIQRLEVLQKAADRLTINSPGFGSIWQAALKESEEEFEKMYSGVIPFLRKHVQLKNDAQLIEDQDSND